MTRRPWRILALLLCLALFGAACGDDEEEAESTGPSAPTFPADTTMAKIQQRGKMIVGVKFDQPGFGVKNPTTNTVEGFDVDIAKLIAVAIFGGDLKDVDSKVELVESVSKNREPFIQDGRVDIVVATYTINNTRKQSVDFAGPYFVAKQDIMVKKDDTAIKSVTDLNGKDVCTVKGSTSETNVRAKAPSANVTLFDTYSQCKEAMLDGRVVAVTTDDTILAGLVKENPDQLKLVKAPFSEEPYGIGLKRCDDPFRNFLNDRLKTVEDDGQWKTAFENTLGKLDLETPQPPTIDRYTPADCTPGATAASTTTSTAAAGSTGGSSGTTTTTASSGGATTTSSSTTTTAAP